MRAAIYFAPPPASLLGQPAACWLGRDAFTGAPARAADPRIDAIVRDPARYGFHATLKAPFRLAEGRTLAALEDALHAFASARQGFVVPALALARLGQFFALVPERANAAVQALEGDVLRHFEPFRAPLTPSEIEKRRPHRLTPRQRELLDRWGYPHVLDEFRFHMTLTGPVAFAEFPWVEAMLSARFASFTGRPLAVEALALFVEPEPGAPFAVRSIHPFKIHSLAESA
jgi:putative phosphonate metabolism protein